MMKLNEHRIDITTDSSGDSTDYSEKSDISGLLYAVKLSNGDLAATSDITLTCTGTPDGVDFTLLTLTNQDADALYYPRHQVHSNAGAGLTLDGTRIAFDMALVLGQIKSVTAQGGDTKSGTLSIYVFE